jgi:nitrous oxidase accessory protein
MKPAVLAAAVVLLSSTAASARTWTVGPAGADFPLIAPALAAAAEGDVIRVKAGVYREALAIHTRVTIVGEGSPVLYGLGSGSVIRVFAPRTEIRGLVIEGSGSGETNEMDAAIQVASSGNRIAGNTMRRVFYGVVVAGGEGNEISDNRIAGFVDLPFGKRGDGVYIYRGAGNRVLRNRIAGQRDGIYFQYAPGGLVEGNLVESSRYGLHVMFAHSLVVRNNMFRDSSAGATIMDSRAIEVAANRFEHNRGTSAVGLTLKQCDESSVHDNVLADNARGLQIDGSSRNRLTANRFRYNDTALVLFASGERNVFSSNEFDSNWTDVIVAGTGAGTSWSDGRRGNAWSGYGGFDFDGDGIGDSPHVLLTPFAAIEGRNPMARLFLRTPAAAGLSLAARAGLGPSFPEQDPAPITASTTRSEESAAPVHRTAASAGTAALMLVLALAIFARGATCWNCRG